MTRRLTKSEEPKIEGEYIPSNSKWVRDQVELYERTNGAEGTTLKESGMPVVIVTNRGHQTGGVRKTDLPPIALPLIISDLRPAEAWACSSQAISLKQAVGLT